MRNEPKGLHGCPLHATLHGIGVPALAQHSWDFVSVHLGTGQEEPCRSREKSLLNCPIFP
jgi:hypothetical protein